MSLLDITGIFPNSEIIEKSPRKLVFKISDCSTQKINHFRRWLISETESTAIEYVEINDSFASINPEILSQRLGLIPIGADPLLFQKFEGTGFTDTNSITLELSVENNTNKTLDVTPKDLKHVSSGKSISDDDSILIVRLYPHQYIDVKCMAIRGSGGVHEKWSQVNAFHKQVGSNEYIFVVELVGETTFENIQTQMSENLVMPDFPKTVAYKLI